MPLKKEQAYKLMLSFKSFCEIHYELLTFGPKVNFLFIWLRDHMLAGAQILHQSLFLQQVAYTRFLVLE